MAAIHQMAGAKPHHLFESSKHTTARNNSLSLPDSNTSSVEGIVIGDEYRPAFPRESLAQLSYLYRLTWDENLSERARRLKDSTLI